MPTPSPAPTETPTATIVWFPPSATPTPFIPPTIPPTVEQRPGLDEVIFTDTFEAPELWTTGVSDSGSVIVAQNQVALAISRPRLYLFSLRSRPVLDNFYAEITARTSLCAGKDEYGLLFRVNSANDYYRYVLTCNGQVRLDRVRGGQLAYIQSLTPSGDAPPGSPGEVRLGVWAVGSEMRFFLDGRYQFTARDPVFSFGTMGVFARSASETAVSVTFSDLLVQQVFYLSPTPSPTPTNTPKPTRTPAATP